MGVFAPARVALATQVPLTALMVVYTFIGLSITAEPIVESRAAAEPTAVASETVAIPADAVLPEAGSGRLQPVGPDRAARLKLTYKVLGSAFHDGTKTSAADLLYAYAFAYRWGARGTGEHGALRSRHRCRHRCPCAGISWACASPASMPPPSRSASATSPSCARSSRSRSTWTSRRRSPNGAPSWRRRGARCPGLCWR